MPTWTSTPHRRACNYVVHCSSKEGRGKNSSSSPNPPTSWDDKAKIEEWERDISDNKKANGNDGISARMLKSTAAAIAPSITKLFNQSIRHTVVFQGAGKRQSLYLYPRNKEPRANNVRPISLLPILSKVLKQHIHFLLTEHICNHSQLSKLAHAPEETRGRSSIFWLP